MSENNHKTDLTPSLKKKVLVVDDDHGILNILQVMLEDEGYEVIKNNGQNALEEISKNLPDLILLDVWLPNNDGGKLSRILKSHPKTKNIPIILISAVSDSIKVIRESRADDFLAKPFNMYDLLFLVKKYTVTL